MLLIFGMCLICSDDDDDDDDDDVDEGIYYAELYIFTRGFC